MQCGRRYRQATICSVRPRLTGPAADASPNPISSVRLTERATATGFTARRPRPCDPSSSRTNPKFAIVRKVRDKLLALRPVVSSRSAIDWGLLSWMIRNNSRFSSDNTDAKDLIDVNHIFGSVCLRLRVASTVNPQVPGSIPGRGAKSYRGLVARPGPFHLWAGPARFSLARRLLHAVNL